jgi:hypothetical protein
MKARHTLPLVLLCVLALVMAVAASCGGGPVAADRAQIEMTYSGDGTSYVGDREIIQGTASVTFSNETTGLVYVDVFRYETGSDGLAQELELVQEGNSAVPSSPSPVEGYTRAWLDKYEPGSHTWTMDLEPGTYIFDAGPEDFMTTGLWRLAVIEVVAE